MKENVAVDYVEQKASILPVLPPETVLTYSILLHAYTAQNTFHAQKGHQVQFSFMPFYAFCGMK